MNILCTVLGHKPIELGRTLTGPAVTCCARCNRVMQFEGHVQRECFPLAVWPAAQVVTTETPRVTRDDVQRSWATLTGSSLGDTVRPYRH